MYIKMEVMNNNITGKEGGEKTVTRLVNSNTSGFGGFRFFFKCRKIIGVLPRDSIPSIFHRPISEITNFHHDERL